MWIPLTAVLISSPPDWLLNVPKPKITERIYCWHLDSEPFHEDPAISNKLLSNRAAEIRKAFVDPLKTGRGALESIVLSPASKEARRRAIEHPRPYVRACY